MVVVKMEETDWSVAKDLFVKHYGSAIQMHREGVYADYKRWDVPQELEEQWIGERIQQLSSELSIMNWDAVDELALIAKHRTTQYYYGNNSICIETIEECGQYGSSCVC